MPDGTSRMSIITSGSCQKLYQFLSCSTWSQYTIVDAKYVVKMDSRLSLPHASFLSCGFTTGFYRSYFQSWRCWTGSTCNINMPNIRTRDRYVEVARVHRAAQIIGIDINKGKREKREAFGMTHYINPKAIGDKSISEMVKELTNGLGVDYSFECTRVSHLVNEALESTKVGVGKTTMLGAGTQKSMEIDFVSLLGCRTFKYSIFCGGKVQFDLPVVIDKCINKEIQKLDQLLTHEVQLNNINRAFDLLKEPENVKVLIQL
ncbi:unnamed protein product [Coffea canephora]|uniref:Alcohol dehydrogenase-like C-terminal domain-containing protein n=1 Tax=Coffea canephora TaxID=49390 RepID=A0A068UAX4_COFCA|nr:unnamed protein product [Coffea canephora]